MKELIRVRVQYASRQQCCKTYKRPLPIYLYLQHNLMFYWNHSYSLSPQKLLFMLRYIMNAITYVGDLIFVSFRLVLGCFWIVSSWPSNVFRYWICCGEGTGIKFGSLFAWFGCCCCFCCAIDCSVRQYMPSTGNTTIRYFKLHMHLPWSPYTVMRHLMTGIYPERWVVRRFHCCVIQCTYTNLDSTV